jgi:phenylacetate-CoA ligase
MFDRIKLRATGFYSKFLLHVIIPFGDFIFRGIYYKSLIKVRQELNLSFNEIDDLKKKRLAKIISHAVQKSAYYKSLMPIGVINKLEDFPILTKEVIRKEKYNLITRPSRSLICNKTSGSTGIQTEIYISKEEQSLIRAIQTTWWQWAGFEIGYPILQTGLATKRNLEKRLKDFFFRTNYLFAFGLNEENSEDALLWARKKNAFLGGYASSLFILAKYSKNKNIQLKSAVSWGDKLFDHYKKEIESNFKCKIYETYGTAEGFMLAAQYDQEYMYIMDPYYILEILDDNNKPVKDGEIGHVVVTSLLHFSMPLIRYKIGDLAIKLPLEKYPKQKKFQLQLLQKVIGRETDIYTTPNGKQLTVHSFTGILEYYPEVKQFQVAYNQFGKIELRYVKTELLTEKIIDQIKLKLNELANEDLKIVFREVDLIIPSPSGKPQILIKENI